MLSNCCWSCKKEPKMKSHIDNKTNILVTKQVKNSNLNDIIDKNIILSDNDDDDVFSEDVKPIVKLSDNLGVDTNKTLPCWFINSQETLPIDNTPATPPVTPIGKDELALKRHRLLSEIIDLAQHSHERRVKFDPFGPIIAGANDDNQRSDLEELICRLEKVTTRLENICLPIEELIEHRNCASNNNIMSVQGFQDIIQGPLAQHIRISQQIGNEVTVQSQLVEKAFQLQYQFLLTASQSKRPNELSSLLLPTSDIISKIQDYREKNRTSQFFNHLSTISESIPALGWVAVSPAPAPYIKEMNDAGQFYSNRVLKEWKEKDKKHVDWVKSWIQTLTELQAYVKQHHTTGVVWAGGSSGGSIMNCAGVPPPPPPGCPPPPPPIDFTNVASGDSFNNDRSALFAQINQGENITRSLKKVTSDMQTHKNPTLREGPAPFKTPDRNNQLNASALQVDKPPVFSRDGKKWIIEYQKGNHSLLIENAEMNNVVYLFRCTDSTVVVKGKINSIIMDSCKKTSVVFDSLVSSMEFINCQSVQMQVFGKVATISIDKTDGCQMYLSPESLNVEIVSSKSSEMNVLVPKENGDYSEFPIPEQFKTTVASGKGLSTVIVENKG